MASSEQLPERLKGADKKVPKSGGGSDGGTSTAQELEPPPTYFKHRIDIFNALHKQELEKIAAQPRESIIITLPNGSIKTGISWETTPGAIAREIGKSLYDRTVVSKVNGELWDLERPLEGNCKLELLDFNTEDGKMVFWHSSAHILGQAAERKYGCDLCIGPPVDDGFYYEMALPGGTAVQQEDWPPLQAISEKVIKEKQPFTRLTVTKEQLLELFQSNKYKQHIIKDKIPDGSSTTVYRCGPLIDLCRGPHVPNTSRVKNFRIMKSSASYFLGDAKNDSLQRIYGVSFPEKQQMTEHLAYLEEAAKRDHRKIGLQQELFFFHESSPGSAFFLPKGAIIYNTLQSFLREEYWKRGYQEVHSPNIFNSEPWKLSGHWQHYSDDMFTLNVEKDMWALKPMNCPGHALIFGHRTRSYQELPIRMAEFAVLHRNEASGALTGLTRVRRFVQDDTHIFCREDQVEQEILELFDFLQTVYGNFGFTFKLKLSTRPEGYLGDLETWEKAEAGLQKALDHFCEQTKTTWELNPGDGAFYGPKIDITISDALRRDFQCATIQLDFNLPRRFNLTYMTKDQGEVKAEDKILNNGATETANKDGTKELVPGLARPVMVHRAIVGSFERFIAILTEHFAGKWPFWLSPRQILIVPVTVSVNDYCREVETMFRERGFHVDCDLTGNTLQKKIRNGQLQSYNYTFVLGVQEMENRAVNVRNRDDQGTQAKGDLVPLSEAIERLEKVRKDKIMAQLSPMDAKSVSAR